MSSRRDFLKNSAFLGVGLVVGFTIDKTDRLFGKTVLAEYEFTPFILIKSDGTVTFVNPNPDMGQGSTQAIPALIAEELEVNLANVKVVQSDGNSKYGVQISGGSGSVRRAWDPLRKAGAAAREMLIKAAASRWKCKPLECQATNATVVHVASGRKFTYGELADEASSFEVPQNPTLKQKKDFKIIGKSTVRPDVVDRVTGKATYGIDVEVPGMVHAAILHSPTILGKIVKVDDNAARQSPGVLDVFLCERPMPHRTTDAIAVIGDSFWSALRGRTLLRAEWDDAGDHLDSQKNSELLKQSVADPGLVHTEHGGFDKAYSVSTTTLEALYETPLLSHVPIEPECATVHVREDGYVDVWAPIQGPDWARRDIAAYLGIVEEKIKINVTLLGGSFGRKAYHDFLLEACFLSRKLKIPVKLIWSREDDLSQGPFRPALLSHLQGIFQKGKITGFHHHAIGESIDGQVHNNLPEGIPDPILCGEIDIANSSYQFANSKISYTRVKTDIPIVWWRSVYASNFAWSQECFIDELAHAAGVDPLEARLDLVSNPRHRIVLEKLRTVSGYSSARHDQSAIGVAIWKSFGSISAAAVTVSRGENGLVVSKVVSVIDCGIYVNPDMVIAQTEGNIIMGLGAATNPGIILSKGRTLQTNLHQYEIMRMREVPKMQVCLIENDEAPGGVGEPGLPPIAPALGNAIFNLTGNRIRQLPIDLTRL